MADASEDAIRPGNGLQNPQTDTLSDSDPDESTPDYRFLSSITNNASLLGQTSNNSSLPKRGIKDFEPHPTNLQASQLDASRQAMHDALSHTRVHAPRGHVVGVYDMRTGSTRVRRPKGTMFKSMGRSERGGAVLLWPEEALWALETGRLDIRWGEKDEKSQEDAKYDTHADAEHKEDHEQAQISQDTEQEDEDEEDLVPMSLQGAYAAFLGEEDERGGFLTVDRYLVYAGLRRSGYSVLRAEGWDGRPELRQQHERTTKTTHYSRGQTQQAPKSLFSFIYNLLLGGSISQDKQWPLVPHRLYRSYEDIFRTLQIIPSWNPSTLSTNIEDVSSNPPPQLSSTSSSQRATYTTHFNVYRPSPNFRKTAPGPPDFRICVVDSRSSLVPTLKELSNLMDEQPVPIAPTTLIAKSESRNPSSDSSKSKTSPPSAALSLQPPHPPSPSALPTSFLSFLHPFLPSSTSTAIYLKHDPIPALYKRLRTGAGTKARNAILAIVDEGVISYIRFTEGVFTGEQMWERTVAATERALGGDGGGGGGKGGGGGRGGRGGRGGARGGRGGRGAGGRG